MHGDTETVRAQICPTNGCQVRPAICFPYANAFMPGDTQPSLAVDVNF